MTSRRKRVKRTGPGSERRKRPTSTRAYSSLPDSVSSRFNLRDTPYELKLPFLGEGTYGICCTAYSRLRKEDVAIKKITLGDLSNRDINRVVREVKILRKMSHKNVVKIYDLFSVDSDLYIVFEKMDTDLKIVIDSGQDLTTRHVQFIMYQLLRGLKYIHSADVIHRDLKPSNILVDAKCHLSICDFGLAKLEENQTQTQYVVTRWYRAPELLMKHGNYDTKIDMWSAGCVLAELLYGAPLFQGRNYRDQIQRIVMALGKPSEEDLESISPRVQGSKRPGELIAIDLTGEDGEPGVNKIRSYFSPGVDPLAVDLVEKLLVLNPSSRLTAEDALLHPFFGKLHDPRDEPSCVPCIRKSLAGVNEVYPEHIIRDEVMKEILLYHPELLTKAHFIKSLPHFVLPEVHRYVFEEKYASKTNKTRQVFHDRRLKQRQRLRVDSDDYNDDAEAIRKFAGGDSFDDDGLPTDPSSLPPSSSRPSHIRTNSDEEFRDADDEDFPRQRRRSELDQATGRKKSGEKKRKVRKIAK